MVVVGDENMPDFLHVPNPDNRFFYSWLNHNSQNMQRRTAMGWRPVPPEHCKRIGLSPYQMQKGCGYAQIYDILLCYIPRDKIEEYNKALKAKEITSPDQIPAIQELLGMARKGVTPFVGDAREVAEFHKWRMQQRGSFSGYRKPVSA